MAEIWDILDENGFITGRTMQRSSILAAGDFHLVLAGSGEREPARVDAGKMGGYRRSRNSR